MPKEIKKYVNRGAPLYMSQFTMIMLILIVFFMIMVTLNKSKEGGVGKSGSPDGDSPTRLNLDMNSVGVFKFGRPKVRKQYINPDAVPDDPDHTSPGQSRSLSEGSGGTGDTDVEFNPKVYGRYINVKLNYNFPYQSANIVPNSMDELRKVGMMLAMWDCPFTIKCQTAEMPSVSENFVLAFKRALQLMRFFYAECGISYNQMECSGVVFDRYLKKGEPAANNQQPPQQPQQQRPQQRQQQGNYLLIYVTPSKDNDMPVGKTQPPAGSH